MPVPRPLQPILDSLERLGLPYCITGSVAASVYNLIVRKLEFLREGG